jgi:hypothetical protein
MECARHTGNYELRPGERPIVGCLAGNLDQASIVHRYIKGYFDTYPALAAWLDAPLGQSYRVPIRLKNNVDIQVTTNNYRAPRGRAIAGAIFDEVAFWRDENSAIPDIETYRAIRPGMSVPTAMMVGISTAYRKKGLLYEKWRDHFGKDDPDVLVIQADTRSFNPTIDEIMPGEIDKALEEDRSWALAEYFSVFRDDLQDYISREVVDAVRVPERLELPPDPKVHYQAFVDPSGGSSDSFALAIGHRGEGNTGILDCLREVMAPFSPEAAVKEFADVLNRYGVREVTGDRYAGEWPRERFREHGIGYEVAEKTKSEYYLEFLPLLNARRVELLDSNRLVGQLCALERRTTPGGREVITKPRTVGSQDAVSRTPGAHDDVANVTAACMVHVAGVPDALEIWRKLGRG